jgi:hypothetical protein
VFDGAFELEGVAAVNNALQAVEVLVELTHVASESESEFSFV